MNVLNISLWKKGLIVEIYFEKTPFMEKIVSLKIQEEIEIYLRLLLQG